MISSIGGACNQIIIILGFNGNRTLVNLLSAWNAHTLTTTPTRYIVRMVYDITHHIGRFRDLNTQASYLQADAIATLPKRRCIYKQRKK
ncbi:hypothetical protein OUZ56_030387 [Daphnia magna]|uniref:Uncharacterized protein n=1 Tax=Daphnia magna TaxID=35525 RepID=A0ABQ9ZR54_9CRUS|nr:hypothetical protein OUZ56_030387 [Daphnia magna]